MLDKDKVILINLLVDYNKNEKKFPKLKYLSKYSETYKFIFEGIEKRITKKELQSIYIGYMDTVINKGKGSSGFRKELYLVYIKNTDLFEKFICLNIFQEDKKKIEFQEIGDEFKAVLDLDWLKDLLLNNMEGGKFKQFSSSTAWKIESWLLEIFPFYNSVWVIVK